LEGGGVGRRRKGRRSKSSKSPSRKSSKSPSRKSSKSPSRKSGKSPPKYSKSNSSKNLDDGERSEESKEEIVKKKRDKNRVGRKRGRSKSPKKLNGISETLNYKSTLSLIDDIGDTDLEHARQFLSIRSGDDSDF
jgi:hypothetical protein